MSTPPGPVITVTGNDRPTTNHGAHLLLNVLTHTLSLPFQRYQPGCDVSHLWHGARLDSLRVHGPVCVLPARARLHLQAYGMALLFVRSVERSEVGWWHPQTMC